MAAEGDLWEKVNPDLENPLPEPVMPQEPRLGALFNVKGIDDLSDTQLARWDRIEGLYKRQMDHYRAERKARQYLIMVIRQSVAAENQHYLVEPMGPYQVLRRLKSVFEPTWLHCKEALDEWRRHARSTPKSQNLDGWLSRWNYLYAKGINLGVPDIEDDGFLAKMDFLEAIRTLDPGFYDSFVLDIPRVKSIEFQRLVYVFKVCHPAGTCEKTDENPPRFAPSTVHDAKGTQVAETSKAKGDSIKCPCGRRFPPNHSPAKCYYLNKRERPQDWVPKERIQKRIERRFANEHGLRKRIEAEVGAYNQGRERHQKEVPFALGPVYLVK